MRCALIAKGSGRRSDFRCPRSCPQEARGRAFPPSEENRAIPRVLRSVGSRRANASQAALAGPPLTRRPPASPSHFVATASRAAERSARGAVRATATRPNRPRRQGSRQTVASFVSLGAGLADAARLPTWEPILPSAPRPGCRLVSFPARCRGQGGRRGGTAGGADTKCQRRAHRPDLDALPRKSSANKC